MDSYPPFGIAWSSPPPRADHGRMVEITSAGTIRGRDLYAQHVWQIEIDHPMLTVAEADQLWQFYDAHRATTFVFVHPLDHSGQPHGYEIHNIEPPEIAPVANSPEYRRARVRMTGYRL